MGCQVSQEEKRIKRLRMYVYSHGLRRFKG